jgi:transcriptional regulator with XRE-family HTH domain
VTELGAIIQEEREALGLTRAGLARELGIARSNVTRWETTEKGPGPEMMAALGDRFGREIVWDGARLTFGRRLRKRARKAA